MVRLPDERSIVLLFNLGVFRFCKEIMPPATVAAILYVNILGVADVYNEKRRQIPAFSSSICTNLFLFAVFGFLQFLTVKPFASSVSKYATVKRRQTSQRAIKKKCTANCTAIDCLLIFMIVNQ